MAERLDGHQHHLGGGALDGARAPDRSAALPADLIGAPGILVVLGLGVALLRYRMFDLDVVLVDNASKHGHAASCWVRITASPTTLTLTIEDDGVGLGDDARAGVGVRSMRERAEELGGTCTVQTRPAGGTIVRATLPRGGVT